MDSGDHGVESLPQRLPVCNSEKTPSNTSTKDLDYMFVTRERHSEERRERESWLFLQCQCGYKKPEVTELHQASMYGTR